MKFQAIRNKADAIKKFDQDKELQKVLADPILDAQIIDLNQKQLYEQGIQSDGSPTGQYSPYTIALKEQYGDAYGVPGRTDHITGLDTGETYQSMAVESKLEGITITADDRNDFFKIEDKGLGLTNESLSEIRPHVRESLVERAREVLANA